MNNRERLVLVAGGGGFIGKPLCRALIARGYRVVNLTRGAARPVSVSPQGALPEAVTWDGRTPRGWGHLADEALGIINLAGESIADGRWTPERKRRILESRVQAAQAVVAAVEAATNRPSVLVQGSAVGYYGDTGQDAVDENSPPGKGFLSDICLRWEGAARPVEALGTRLAVARTGLVMGRGGGVLEKMLTPFKLFLGGPLGDGHQGFPWIHIEDEVRALIFLLENPEARGPFNLCAPETTDNLGFCRELAKALSRPCGLAAPGAALKLLFGEMAQELLLSGCRAFPRRLMELGFEFSHPRLAGALKHLFA